MSMPSPHVLPASRLNQSRGSLPPRKNAAFESPSVPIDEPLMLDASSPRPGPPRRRKEPSVADQWTIRLVSRSAQKVNTPPAIGADFGSLAQVTPSRPTSPPS